MKYILYLLIFSCLFSSCSDKKSKNAEIDYSNFYERKLWLLSDYPTDSLACVSIKVPTRLDTFYQWHNISDCSGCGLYMSRFADMNYSLLAESGFVYLKEPDSTYQFTISFRDGRDWPDSLYREVLQKDTIRVVRMAYKEDEYLKNSLGWILRPNFLVINDRPFLVGIYNVPSIYRNKEKKIAMIAITNIRKREITILAECDAKDTLGFINNMYKSLLSIKIEEK